MWDKDNVTIKPCSVVLEPLTPQKQLALSAELKLAINERNMLTTRTRKKVIDALDELDRSSPSKNTRANRKKQAIQEILDSEVNYLRQLEIVKCFFMEPVREKGLLRDEDYKTLFGNVETIYNVNGELLNELKMNMFNVATAFKNLAPYFKLYSIYAYDYRTSINILQREEKEGSAFAKFVKAQETRPEVQSKLSALLISPIQRIPRYQLLLKQVLENSTSEEEDYETLLSSYCRIEEVARHINNLVDDQDNTQKMLSLQRSLLNQKPNLVKPGRRILKSGLICKLTSNGRHLDRYCVLMTDILIFCKMKGDDISQPNSLKCSSIFPLGECRVTEVLSRGCFKISCQDEEVLAYHRDLHVGRAWKEAIKAAIERHQKDRMTLRRDESQRRPAKRKALVEYEEPGISPGRPLKKRVLDNEIKSSSPKTNKRSNDVALNPTANKSSMLHFMPRKRNSTRSQRSLQQSVPKALQEGPETTESLTSGSEGQEERTSTATSGSNESFNMATDVYVFGSERNRRFTFGLGTIFRGIRNSVRSIFGFQ